MPAKNMFGEDRLAMVDAIFAEQDQALIERLRAQADAKATREELAAISGITDEGLLTKLTDLGISAGTLRALQMIPLIEVAWADGKVDPPERDAILKSAAEHGIETGTDEFALLEGWLGERPADRLLETWVQYTQDICSTLDPGERDTLKHELLDRAQEVAESAGGLLGLGRKISAAEQEMLDRLAAAF